MSREPEKINVIFLDIDGVLNDMAQWIEDDQLGHPYNHRTLDILSREKIGLLSRIIEATSTDEVQTNIVLSSTWRLTHSIPDMHQMFLERTQNGWKHDEDIWAGKTDNRAGERGRQIDRWLSNHGSGRPYDVQNYVILDDDSDMTGHQRMNHFVKTKGEVGLTYFEMKLAIAILNNDDKMYVDTVKSKFWGNIC